MKFSYKITNKTLGHIYDFGRYQERLDLLLELPHWRKRLLDIVEHENASAAVTIDKEVTHRWTFKPGLSSLRRYFSEEIIADYKKYLYGCWFVERLPEKTIIDVTLLRKLHYSLMNGQAGGVSYFRNSRRLLRKFTREMGIEKEARVEVKTPPGKIPERLVDLFQWFVEVKEVLHPLIIMGVLHYKVAKIHPFGDGNGRLVRILEKLLLKRLGVYYKYLMLEDYYLRQREEYYDIIAETIESGDLTAWLEFYTGGLVFAARQPIAILKELSGGAVDLESMSIISLTNREIDVIELLNEFGQLSAADIGRKLNITRQTASTIIKGVLKKKLVRKVGANTNVRFMLEKEENPTIHIVR